MGVRSSDWRGAALLALFAVVFAGHPACAATITLGSDADTYLRDETVRGGFVFMDVRGNPNDFDSYLRFDLSALGGATITDASLKLTVSGGASRNDTLVASRFALYGLNNVAGNTPQNWDESLFVLSGRGTENPETTTGVTDLDQSVAGISEILNPAAGSAAPGTTATVSGAPLVSFLQGRLGDGGLATFIINMEDDNDRGYGLATKENANADFRPMLTLTYIPEPASFVLALGSVALIGPVVRRRCRTA
jgi:hypothetical protein